MLKINFWQKIQGNKLTRPFQVKDKANKTLLARAKWLLFFSVLVTLLFFVSQNHQINLLINRNFLESAENNFTTSFYPAYSSAYYWLSYQDNLAAKLNEVLQKKGNIEKFFTDLVPQLNKNPEITSVQYGIAGTIDQWLVHKTDGQWLASSSVDQEFSAWLLGQNYESGKIYWAENNFANQEQINLFWFYINDKNEKAYFKITANFAYREELKKIDFKDNQAMVLFFAPNEKNQLFQLQSTAEAEVSTASLKLASNQATLQQTSNFIEQLNPLFSQRILELYQENGEIVFPIDLGKNNFWVKVTPVETHTGFNLMAVILSEKEPLHQFGISSQLVMILVIAFLIINFITFLVYYFKYSKRYYFTNQIKEVIKDGENALLEFKSSLRFDYKLKELNKNLEAVVLKSIAAFNNSDGGLILLGINDQGKVLGLKNDYETLKKNDKDGFELHLRGIISQAYGEHFAARRIEIFFPLLGKEEVCAVKVKKGRTPIYTMAVDKTGNKQEKFYIRMGNSSREIEKPSDIVVYQKERFGWKLRVGKK